MYGPNMTNVLVATETIDSIASLSGNLAIPSALQIPPSNTSSKNSWRLRALDDWAINCTFHYLSDKSIRSLYYEQDWDLTLSNDIRGRTCCSWVLRYGRL